MRTQHLIWDWNGTLLDDLALCLGIINYMLEERELPALSQENYLEAFDFPVQDYYRRIGFDFRREPFEAVSDQFIQAYEAGRPDCQLMDGAREALDHFARLGLSQSVLSASRRIYLRKAVQEYGIEGYFSAVEGLEDHHAAGKLALARDFLESVPLGPEQMTLVGDTTHDGEIASQLGLNCLLIPNGHHSRERLEKTGHPVLSSLRELPGHLP